MKIYRWLITFILVVPSYGQEVNLVDYARRTYQRELKQIKGVRRMGTTITTNWTGVDGDAALGSNWDNGLARDGDTQVIPKTSTQAIISNMGSEPAAGTLTFTGNAGNTETVVIDTKTYTFQTSLTDVDGNVLIGVDAEASRDNLVSAINLTAGAGSTYAASTTIHPTARAIADDSADIMDAVAKTAGTAGNSIATTETLGSGGWSDTTMNGGAASGVKPALLLVDLGYTKDIMSSGTPAIMAPTRIQYRGSGSFYFQPSIVVSAADLICNSSNFTNAITISGTQNVDGNVDIISGKLIYNDTGTLGNVWLASSRSIFQAPSSAGTISKIYMVDGLSDVSAVVTDMYQSGGQHTQNTNLLSTLILTGGLFIAKADGTLWNIMAGTCDFSQSIATRTVTTLNVMPTGTVIGDEDLVTTTRHNIGE